MRIRGKTIHLLFTYVFHPIWLSLRCVPKKNGKDFSIWQKYGPVFLYSLLHMSAFILHLLRLCLTWNPQAKHQRLEHAYYGPFNSRIVWKSVASHIRAIFFQQISLFNYWPGQECSPTQTPRSTHTRACTHPHKHMCAPRNSVEWFSRQVSTVHTRYLRGQSGVSWIMDEFERGSLQISSTRLTPLGLP